MKADAWSSRGYEHEARAIAKEPCDPRLKAVANGAVEIRFQSTGEIDLRGTNPYNFKIVFSKAEIDEMHRLSYVSSAQGLIEKEEPKRPAEPQTFRRR